MKRTITLGLLLICFVGSSAQNSFPTSGITTLSSGGDQNLFIKDNRAGTNWNYLEWQFNNGSRDWVLGRHASTGSFTLVREGIGEIVTVDNAGRMGLGTTSPGNFTRLNLVGAGLEISATPHQLDASLHISTAYGLYGRLTQIHPSALNSPALNLMANIDSQGGANWWSWGVLNNGSWGFQPTTSFGGANGLFIDRAGHVGIGATTSTAQLTVVGSASSEESIVNITNNSDQDFQVRVSAANAAVKRTMLFPSTPGRLSLGVGVNNEYLTITNGGNVGIGSVNPNQKLTVNGTIYGKEVKVDLSVPGPDYVFSKTYSLRSLKDVESYIEENQHLPEVPSATEMEKDGIKVGEMNMLLLKKVEELTLYAIRQQQQIDQLKREIELIQKKN